MAAHQQNVPGFQMIGFSFYVIRHFAGKKHNDLVKIVIVIGKCPVPAGHRDEKAGTPR